MKSSHQIARARWPSLIIAGVLFGSVLANGFAGPSSDGVLVLVKARVYLSPFAKPLAQGVIVVRNGKIEAVGTDREVPISANARIVDCSHMTVVAGFQNSHIHFAGDSWDDTAHISAARLAKQLEGMLTRYGFTTVVDLGSGTRDTATLRGRIDSGEIKGPRILTAGQPLFPEDGIPYQLRATLSPAKLHLLKQPSTTQQAEESVRQNIKDGANVVKLFTGVLVDSHNLKVMPLNIAMAAAEEAHRHHMLVFAHPGGMAGFKIALAARVDVMAHASDFGAGGVPEYLERMKQANIALIPTLNLYRYDPELGSFLNEVSRYSRMGGQILFGTDAGDQNRYDPADEYALMQRAGLSWAQILASLTTAPAERFGESQSRGRIAPGMAADLVVLDADPAEAAGAFTEVRYTIRGGTILYRKEN